jgi:hypothetical protein
MGSRRIRDSGPDRAHYAGAAALPGQGVEGAGRDEMDGLMLGYELLDKNAEFNLGMVFNWT